MTHVVAGFDTASLADMALQDLEVARIPSAVVQRYAAADPDQRITPDGHSRGCAMVTVTVDELHAEAVTEILNQHGSVSAH